MSEVAFQAGETLRLRSGGPLMSFDGADATGLAICTWFDGTTRVRGTFVPETLERGDKPKPSGVLRPLYERVSASADSQGRSVNAEIVGALEAAYPAPVIDVRSTRVSEWFDFVEAAADAEERHRRIEHVNHQLSEPHPEGLFGMKIRQIDHPELGKELVLTKPRPDLGS